MQTVSHSEETSVSEIHKSAHWKGRCLDRDERLVRCYAVFGPGQPLRECAYLAPSLGEDEVEIKVQFCGVCHDDVAMIRNEYTTPSGCGFNCSAYPFTPGHEIIGTVVAKGSNVPDSELQLGTRVGVGLLKQSCDTCEYCTSGRANLCLKGVPICGGELAAKGGFAEFVRVHRNWAIPVPLPISSPEAAPLLCAGCSVYSPLIKYGIGRNSNVAVIGFGGVGHLFVQMARALGARVTVFSTSSDKERDAKALGAAVFVLDIDDDHEFANSFDLIVNATYVNLDWNKYLRLVKPGGVFCILGTPTKSVNVDPTELIRHEKTIAGSVWASQCVIRDMFDFCVKHNIRPEVELFKLYQCQDVISAFDKEGFHYRAVLDLENGFVESEAEAAKRVIAKGG